MAYFLDFDERALKKRDLDAQGTHLQGRICLPACGSRDYREEKKRLVGAEGLQVPLGASV